jgi:hypothetical protein
MTKLVSVYQSLLSSMGLLIFHNGPTCLCLNSTMSTYDYVYLILEAMSSMTLLSQCLHIHFQFIFILFISSNFKLYLFLTTNEIYLFSNIEGRFLLFVLAPCVPSSYRWFTLGVITSSFLIRFCCHLLRCVA